MTDYLIANSEIGDLETVCQLFEEAILFQKKNNYIGWHNYDKAFLEEDIQNGLLLKVISNGSIAGIFSICYNDELIWREMEKGDSVYLHRIVLNQRFKGEKLFKKVLEWGISHAKEKKLNYIRMDTWASNEKIINYYKSYGFSFIENYTTPDTEDLPVQHRNLNVALLQLQINFSYNSTGWRDIKNKRGHISKLKKINIHQELAEINQYWTQKIIGQANGQLIKLAKGIGEINWHKHDDQDELFILFKGQMTIQLREGNIDLFPNEMFIVPKGIEHCPLSHGHSEFLIMGINITSNTEGGRPASFSKIRTTT